MDFRNTKMVGLVKKGVFEQKDLFGPERPIWTKEAYLVNSHIWNKKGLFGPKRPFWLIVIFGTKKGLFGPIEIKKGKNDY